MKVMLICVGLQDPYNLQGQPGPILSFLDYIKRLDCYKPYHPDRIYLLSTAKKADVKSFTQDKGEELTTLLTGQGWKEVYHRILDVSDATDYQQLIPQMENVVNSIVSENPPDADYFVNVSPGTGQMEAVWLVLVNSGKLKATLLQVKSPQDEADEQKRIREVEIEPLFESELIRLGSDIFANYTFHRASDVFATLAIKTPKVLRCEAAELFSELAEAYALWENFEYQKALEALRPLPGRNIFRDARFKGLFQLLQDQIQVLEKLSHGDLFTSALDLYHNARRRLRVGHYVECLWRCWATYELVVPERARAALCQRCNLPSNFSLPFKFQEFVRRSQGQPEVQRIIQQFGDLSRVPKYLGYEVAEDFLKRTNDPLKDFIQDKNNESEIDWLADRRHQALHQVTPPDEDECQRGLKLIKKLLQQTFQSDIRYPFSPADLERIIKQIPELM